MKNNVRYSQTSLNPQWTSQGMVSGIMDYLTQTIIVLQKIIESTKSCNHYSILKTACI